MSAQDADAVADGETRRPDDVCVFCGSDTWLTYQFDVSRRYCLACDNEWTVSC